MVCALSPRVKLIESGKVSLYPQTAVILSTVVNLMKSSCARGETFHIWFHSADGWEPNLLVITPSGATPKPWATFAPEVKFPVYLTMDIPDVVLNE